MINEGRRTRCANSVSRALHIQAGANIACEEEAQRLFKLLERIDAMGEKT